MSPEICVDVSIRMHFRLFVALTLANLVATLGLLSAVHAQPLGASQARIDIVAQAGNLLLPGIAPPIGTAEPMSWLGAEAMLRSTTVTVPIHDFGNTEFEVQFSVSSDTEVKFDFMGPWKQSADGKQQELTVLWNVAQIVDGKLNGFTPGTAWHNRPIKATYFATANRTIRLRCSVTVPPVLRPQTNHRPAADSVAFTLAKSFRRGVNLANFLEVPPDQNWGNHSTRAADFQLIKNEGFDHVRIPVAWHHYCGPAPHFRIDAAIMRRVEQQLDFAQQVGLAAIVNLHHFDDFTADPHQHQPKLLKIWQQVATLVKDRPLSVALEILNEPSAAATTAVMNDVYASVIPSIRQIDSQRAIFVGPGHYNQSSELAGLRLPTDDRLIVTVHSYAPFYFTHQGAEWSAEGKLLAGIKFPGPPVAPVSISAHAPAELKHWIQRYNQLPPDQNPGAVAAVAADLKLASDWGRYWNRPIHLGEFGAYRKAPPEDRARYYETVRREAERLGMGWCIWDWKAGFAYWDRATGEAHHGLQQALFSDKQK